MSVTIEFAEPSDLPTILSLLGESGLPEAGLLDRPSTLILAAKEDNLVVGCAALELYGVHGLLRSVAVASDQRGRGLGARLTETALALASKLDIVEVYLLTESAEGFFTRHGFEPTERAAVPSPVAQSVEFSSCCCDGATTMVRRLGNHPGGLARPERSRRQVVPPGLSLHDLAPAWDDRAREKKAGRVPETDCRSDDRHGGPGGER